MGHSPLGAYITDNQSQCLLEPAGILIRLHTCRGQQNSSGKLFSAQLLIIVICKNRLGSCYTITKNTQKHRYTATRLAKPGRCYPPEYAGPGEIGRLPDETTAPPTGPTDQVSEATIVKDLYQQPRSITVHHIHARNCGGIKSS